MIISAYLKLKTEFKHFLTGCGMQCYCNDSMTLDQEFCYWNNSANLRFEIRLSHVNCQRVDNDII